MIKPVIHEEVAESIRTRDKWPRRVVVENYPTPEEFEGREFFVMATKADIPPTIEEVNESMSQKVDENTFTVRVATGQKIIYRLIQELSESERTLIYDYFTEAMSDEMFYEFSGNMWKIWL